MRGNRKLFLSAVSSEFVNYRELLAKDLKRPSLDVAVQEDFIVTGASALIKLDDYIRACDGVIHLIGKATGTAPEEPAVAALLEKYPDLAEKLPPLAPFLKRSRVVITYTQWEAYLAKYHSRPLFVYLPTDFESATLTVPRDARFRLSDREVRSQVDHYQRVCALGHDRGQFSNEERLSSAVLRDLVEILPRLETTIDVSPTKLRHSAERLIGRDAELARLDAAWNDPNKNVVVLRAFGGMGKTSLVATWMAELATKNWRGAERVFDWSFYSQGTHDQRAVTGDSFIAAALRAFGDTDPAAGSAWERGARLTNLVGKRRCLLVLDGLEPLQWPPGQMGGKIKDTAVEALLKGLVAHNKGLCVVTTREKLTDIQQHYGRSGEDIELTALTDLAGARLLHYHGARYAGPREIKCDDKELQTASREVRGHGLTLQLLGQYLQLAENGDIRKRGTVRLSDAEREYKNDATRPYGHAFKAMEAYEKWFRNEGEEGWRQLAVLKLLGLFDRPATKGCLDALRRAPAISGLTEPIVGLTTREWNVATKRLEEINLLTVQFDGSLDAHPLLREYFAQRHRVTQSEVWREAHQRLYEHLCATTNEGNEPTIEDLQPLYQAVAHGCQAGLQQEASDNVYRARIRRGNKFYSSRRLGAFGSDLAAIACFFDIPWSHVSPALRATTQSWLLCEAGNRLRDLGRLTEALEPLRAALESDTRTEDWQGAGTVVYNLNVLELALGDLVSLLEDAAQSVTYADRSADAVLRTGTRATRAHALHLVGRRDEAVALFCEAEQIQIETPRSRALLYSLEGFRYCDLLLSEAEREAARAGTMRLDVLLAQCRSVSKRVAQTLVWMTEENWLLDIACDHLTLGRALLYAAILGRDGRTGESTQAFSPLRVAELESAATEVDLAVTGLRRAGTQHELPRGLLTRAWLRSLTGPLVGPNSAQSDLDEAWEIAERGPMPLFLADILLYRARIFFREPEYPWNKDQSGTTRGPKDDLTEARRLIFKHRYFRRKEELEDAEAALTQL